MSLLIRIIVTLFSLYELLIILHTLVSWLRPTRNRWTTLLESLVEPVLGPIRTTLQRILPPSFQVLDFSPLVALLLLHLVQRLVVNLLTIWM